MANRSAPPGPIMPTLISRDLAEAIDWLCGAFGFTERLRSTGGDGKVGHAQLLAGGGGIMLGGERIGQGAPGQNDTAAFRTPRPDEVTQILAVRVENVEE